MWLRVLVAGLILLLFCRVGLPQETLQSDYVRDGLKQLIAELQDKVARQAAGDKSAYFPQGPINTALSLIGTPEEIYFSAPVSAQGLLHCNVHIEHQKGSSDWTLSIGPDQRIIAYTFSVSRIGPPSGPSQVPPGDIFGGPNSVINNPGSIFGTPIAAGQPLPNIFYDQRPFHPLPPTQQPPLPQTTPLPPLVDPRVVEFLFATTRLQSNSAGAGISYTGERGPLTFGAASVRIPDDHKIGRIELPSSWSIFGIKLFTQSYDNNYFLVKSVSPLSEEAFDRVARSSNSKTALIFVHGFNNTFEDAIYRHAQIVWDLQYQGLSVMFSWASRGDMADYIYDKESAYLAREAFVSLIKKLRREFGVENINVIAHSMGNLAVLDALANYAQTSDPVGITHLIMAAPDVDRDAFKNLAPAAKAIVGEMTLYASSADKALALSRRLAGGIPRAGDVPSEGPIILPNLETIDVTAIGEDIFGLNHNTFAASRDVMEDISVLLRLNQPAPRLIQIRGVPEPPSIPQYWRFLR